MADFKSKMPNWNADACLINQTKPSNWNADASFLTQSNHNSNVIIPSMRNRQKCSEIVERWFHEGNIGWLKYLQYSVVCAVY
jgi:hypothetical protein